MLLLLLASPGIWGQAPKPHPLQNPSVTFGVKGGINFPVMGPVSRNESAGIQYHSLHGGYIGAFIHRPLTSRWAFRPELILSFHGFGAQHDAGYTFMVPPDDHYSLGYINLPLLLQYVAPAGVMLQGGLQPGAVWHRYRELKRADLAWVIGAGHITSKGIGVEVRYTAGMVNLANKDYEDSYIGKVKNKVVQLGLVYMFNREKQQSKDADVLTKLLFP